MNYLEDTGKKVLSDAELSDINLAEDDLQNLRNIKQDFYHLIDLIRKYANLSDGDFEDGIVCMEQYLDDMLFKEWNSTCKRAHTHEEIPQSKVAIDWLIKQQTKRDKLTELSFTPMAGVTGNVMLGSPDGHKLMKISNY